MKTITPQKKRDVLEHCLPFWNALNSEQKDMLVDQFRILNDKRGSTFYDVGNNLSGPKILTGGLGRLFITTEDGREITLFHILDRQLCLISAICSIQRLPYTFNLEILSDSQTYYLPAEYYQKLSWENKAVALFNHQVMENRLLEMIVSLSQASFAPMNKRLAGKLLMYYDLLKSKTLPLTHEMMAKDVGSTRETISRTLKEWEAQGLLHLTRGKIHLLDVDTLKRISQ